MLALTLSACQPSKEKEAPAPPIKWLSPDVSLGQLFADVQTNRIFPDGKTFVDCTPKSSPSDILEKYQQEKGKPGFDLKAFIEANFELPASPSDNFKSDTSQSVEQHINILWAALTRQPDVPNERSTLLPLPKSYVVPGGRFREVYYWDSYFTMLGLQVSGKADLIENMLDNFAYLLDTVGFIPNGNRTYYLGRSQPPFFSLMVGVLAEMKGDAVFQKYLPALENEYAFWMDGADSLTAAKSTHRRVVRLADGTVMNRYWDDRPLPRPESYREDVETAKKSGRPAEEMYRHLRAGAESGWDFSSRWFADGKTIETIRTTDIVPVDLNALLYNLEFTLGKANQLAGKQDRAALFQQKMKSRFDAVQRYCWNADAGFFMDYDFKKGELTFIPSLAAMYPLFFNMATKEQALLVSQSIEEDFLRAGGVISTPHLTGQQWDAPNGWAPLQWLTIKGLENYGHKKLATTITRRWLALNTKVFKHTGKMLEKYNVQDLSLDAGGGEYPVQDGFGWTNGVFLRLTAVGGR